MLAVFMRHYVPHFVGNLVINGSRVMQNMQVNLLCGRPRHRVRMAGVVTVATGYDLIVQQTCNVGAMGSCRHRSLLALFSSSVARTCTQFMKQPSAYCLNKTTTIV